MAGYNYEKGKSNNAIDAESMGLFPASVIAKRCGVCVDAVKKVLEPTAWHHTSGWYNATDYYELAEVVPEDDDDVFAIEKLAELRSADARIKSELKQHAIYENCIVNWIEWSGTRKRPIANEKTANNCTVTVKGKTATITTADGFVFKKRITTNGFSFTKEDNL